MFRGQTCNLPSLGEISKIPLNTLDHLSLLVERAPETHESGFYEAPEFGLHMDSALHTRTVVQREITWAGSQS